MAKSRSGRPPKAGKGTVISADQRGGYQTQSQFVLQERRKRVAEMYLQGKPQWEIARELELHVNTINKDIKAIRDEWLAERRETFDEAKQRELMKLDRLEEQLWDAWFRSCAPEETRIVKLRKSPEIPKKLAGEKGRGLVEDPEVKLRIIERNSILTRKGQSGDPRFTEQIKSIIEMRLKILGAFIQEKQSAVNILNISWDQLLGRPIGSDPIEEEIAKAGRLLAPLKEGEDGKLQVPTAPASQTTTADTTGG